MTKRPKSISQKLSNLITTQQQELEKLKASNTPASGGASREEIARAVSPDDWALVDEYRSMMAMYADRGDYSEMNSYGRMIGHRSADSLKIADAILALLTPRAVVGEDSTEQMIAELCEALEPFAKAAEHCDDVPGIKTHDNCWIWQTPKLIERMDVTRGNFRKARATLAKAQSRVRP